MSTPLDPVDAILSLHGIPGPWTALPVAGVANRIYATRDVVLRVASDHVDAVADARTESVAAPAARAAGIRVPRLIAFDDSRTLIDRPYSLWERIHAETCVGSTRTWRELGAELARLHDRISSCADPRSWLDEPSRDERVLDRLAELARRGRIDPETARRLERWLVELRPALAEPMTARFVHNDAHAGNVLCTRDGELVALIDWGDAGWGDPAIELASVPIDAVPHVVAGYEGEGGRLGGDAEARILFDQVAVALESIETDQGPDPLAPLTRFVRQAAGRWRRLSSRS